MCGHCGCGDDAATTVLNLETGNEITMERGAHRRTHGHGHSHDHGHDHVHEHAHDHIHGYEHSHDHVHVARTARGELVELEARILAKNDAMAEKNRAWFKGREILALNLDEFAGRRQDDAARADDPGPQGQAQTLPS